MTDRLHQRAEQRSLALHRVVAERLRADPRLLERAQERVARWLREGTVARPWAEAWSDVLASGPAGIERALLDEGPRGRDLRQCSPFSFVLRPRERWAVLRSLRASEQS